MSDLPGNLFADDLYSYADPRNSLEAHATLALAYEQRTANLIALAQLNVSANGSNVDLRTDVAEIAERLGMRAEK